MLDFTNLSSPEKNYLSIVINNLLEKCPDFQQKVSYYPFLSLVFKSVPLIESGSQATPTDKDNISKINEEIDAKNLANYTKFFNEVSELFGDSRIFLKPDDEIADYKKANIHLFIPRVVENTENIIEADLGYYLTDMPPSAEEILFRDKRKTLFQTYDKIKGQSSEPGLIKFLNDLKNNEEYKKLFVDAKTTDQELKTLSKLLDPTTPGPLLLTKDLPPQIDESAQTSLNKLFSIWFNNPAPKIIITNYITENDGRTKGIEFTIGEDEPQYNLNATNTSVSNITRTIKEFIKDPNYSDNLIELARGIINNPNFKYKRLIDDGSITVDNFIPIILVFLKSSILIGLSER